MKNDAVGPIEVGADQAGGHGRIDDDDLGVVGLGELVDSTNEHRLWQQPWFAAADHGEVLGGIPGLGSVVRGGVHDDVVGGQTPPQLPEVVLDAADLRREVVGDEQVPDHARTLRPRDLVADLERLVVGEFVGHRNAEPTGDPHGVSPQHHRRVPQVTLDNRSDGRGRPGHIAEHEERIATQVVGVTVRDVPTPESGQEFVVAGVEHAQNIDPRLVGTGG